MPCLSTTRCKRYALLPACFRHNAVFEILIGDRTLLVGGTGATGAFTTISVLELHPGLTTIFASQRTERLIINDDMYVHEGLQPPYKAIPLSIMTSKPDQSK
jgi:hypothetical protein